MNCLCSGWERLGRVPVGWMFECWNQNFETYHRLIRLGGLVDACGRSVTVQSRSETGHSRKVTERAWIEGTTNRLVVRTPASVTASRRRHGTFPTATTTRLPLLFHPRSSPVGKVGIGGKRNIRMGKCSQAGVSTWSIQGFKSFL